ncbi:MAG: methyltransferase [Oscillospiraceae bacterium]|nr:methyltransferase [Oscillospiraceae bacterium]
MDKQTSTLQSAIRLGTHGEDYGSWMSKPVFYMMGGFAAAALILAALSFAVFHVTALGIIFVIALIALLAFIGWMIWIRRQYAFGGGRMMDKAHQAILSNLDYDGNGTLLEVGCGSGALTIRAALTWPQTKVVGIDYWGSNVGLQQSPVREKCRVRGRSIAVQLPKGRCKQARFCGRNL